MFSFRGDIPNLKHSSKEDFIFQAIEWIGLDFKDEDDDEEEDENPYNQKDGNYLIKIYGCTKDCQSVCVKVENFKPYFFVKVWDNFNKSDLSKFRNTIKDKVFKKYQNSLENVEIIKRKEFYGFTNEKLYKFIKLSFKSIGGMKGYVRIFYEPLKISYNSKPYQYRLYESNIDPMLRFNHEQETKPVSWIKLPKGKFKSVHKDLKETICNFEFKIDHSDVQPFECPDIGPMLVASFDIECVSMDGGFPEAKKEGDKVIQIGTTVHRHGETDCCLKHIIVLGPCHEIEGAIVESYETEEEVLLAWRNFMKRLDPDILTGYNIWGFDLKYMYDRAKLLEIDTEFCQIGRLRDKVEILEEKTLQSSALGQNFFYILQMEGRIQIDLMKVVQRDFKLEMYKLDFVAETFLGEHKVDLPPKELFKKFIAGGAQNNQDIAIYCVQDCELVNRLINKLQILTNNVGMGNVCLVPLSWLFLRGQGVKIYSLVACQCRKEGFLIKLVKKGQTVSGEDDEGGYEGAIVLVAEPGVYMEPISVMDYASLYPSSMLSENISHDSVVYYKIYDNYGNIVNGYDKKGWYPLVEFKEADEKDKLDEYLDKLGYKSNYITYDNFEGEGDKKYKSGVTKCCYAERKEPDEIYKSTKSVVPRILDNLLWERRSTRASAFYQRVILKDGTTIDGEVEIKDGQHWVGKYKQKKNPYPSSEVVSCKDIYSKFQQDVLDGLQLAYKVTANSLYGQVGAPTSPIYFKELAASTTATGRDLLRKAQYYTETKFLGAKCVYGDSVTGDTPLILRDKNGDVLIKTIESLSDEYIPYEGFKVGESNRKEKQQAQCDYQIWVKDHWADIKRVIRHKTLKKLYRVNTHTGIVDVTEDHSLLDEDGNKIKATECFVGKTKLLSGFPTEFIEKYENITELSDKLLNADMNSRMNFIKKYLTDNFEFIYSSENKLEIQQVYYLAKSVGILNIEVLYEKNKYFIRSSKNSTNQIKKIIDLGETDDDTFVYDIETSSHRFSCGIGEICASNTDSVFVSFTKYMEDVLGWDLSKKTPKEILEKSIELGIEAGKWVTSHLKKPHDLEYEKTFYPFIQLAKKRYVGNKYEINPDKFKQTSMGIVLKRRDNANICKRVYGGIIDIILNKRDIQGALLFFKEAVKNLLDGKDIDDPTQPLDLKDLVITKTLRGTYKGTFDTSIKLENYEKEKVVHIIEKLLRQRYGDDGLKDYRDELKKLTYDKKSIEEFLKKAKINDFSTDISWEFVNCSQCHTALSRRMGERDPGNKPQSNDRIPFVYIQVKEKKGVKTLQGDKVEHPQYIRDNPDKCKPDWFYYLEHQVKVPCIQLFALVLEQIPGYKPGMVDMSVIDKWRDKGKSEKELKKKLLTLRESATEKLLLGEMINKEINRQKGNTMLTDFFKVATRDEVFENMKTSLLSLKKKEPTLTEVKTKVNLKVKEKPTEELDFASKKRVIKIKVEKKKAKEKEKVEKKRKPREKLTEEEKVTKRKNARKEKLEQVL